MHRYILVFLLFVQSVCAGSFHFYLDHGYKKCFHKEISRGTLLIGRYWMEILDPDTNAYIIPRDKTDTGVLIDVEEVFDSNHRVVHQRGTASGQFTFSAIDSGDHRICLTPKSFFKKKWLDGGGSNPNSQLDSKFKNARISIDFIIGDGSIIDSKHTHSVQTLSEKIHQLNDKLIDIRREQQFIRDKEEQFRDLSERTCEHVVRWSVVQVGAILLACIYQMFKLSTFFLKQKIA